jgi:hypothetical protein
MPQVARIKFEVRSPHTAPDGFSTEGRVDRLVAATPGRSPLVGQYRGQK